MPRSYQVTPARSLCPVGGTSTASHDRSGSGTSYLGQTHRTVAEMVTLTLSSPGAARAAALFPAVVISRMFTPCDAWQTAGTRVAAGITPAAGATNLRVSPGPHTVGAVEWARRNRQGRLQP